MLTNEKLKQFWTEGTHDSHVYWSKENCISWVALQQDSHFQIYLYFCRERVAIRCDADPTQTIYSWVWVYVSVINFCNNINKHFVHKPDKFSFDTNTI